LQLAFAGILLISMLAVVLVIKRSQLGGGGPTATPTPAEEWTNSMGMRFIRIEPGTFTMGHDYGDWDEEPIHKVTISQPFYIQETLVKSHHHGREQSRHRRDGYQEHAARRASLHPHHSCDGEGTDQVAAFARFGQTSEVLEWS
jgi:hypothetical protein